MKFQETETIELKSFVTDEIKKEIIALANTAGGKIFVGVNDDGEVIGLEDPDESSLKISNMVRDSIKPDVTMFIHYETLDIDGKNVLEVSVQKGTNKPYYLSSKGLRSEGVFVRQGNSSVSASDMMIRLMIKETDHDSFENMISLNQKLTFEYTKQEFLKRKITFASSQMKTLHIVSSENLYTNLGLILSDECKQTTKFAAFEGNDQNIFKDRREFSGSILKQLNDVYDCINLHNQIHSKFDKLLRIDSKDYPDVAIREALLNSLVHRDYSQNASTLISLYSDRIEFVSYGGLVSGLSIEDIMNGISICRNPNLANIFYRLELIEAYGTGIRKIMDAYNNYSVKPKIIATHNTFKIILPNVFNSNKIEVANNNSLSINEKEVINYLESHDYITRNDAQILLSISQTTALNLLKSLSNKGIVVSAKKGKTPIYSLIK